MKQVSMVLCGVGGYGATYVRALLGKGAEHGVRWVGAVEPFPDRVSNKEDIDAAGVPWFPSLEAFYEKHTADVCCIAAPIQFHAPLAIYAMEHGSHVLCEKPVCALPSEAEAMAKVRDATGKMLAIGYQWSYSRAVLALKRDIMAGVYGKPVDLQCTILWPRPHTYYARGVGWAGKLRDGAGRWVLDSVANNATAHYLHNMLYILGDEGKSAMPETLTASLYRANPIDMYDTMILEARMGAELGGGAVRFLTTHASEGKNNVLCDFRFEKGTVAYDGEKPETARFVGTLADGRVIDYGNPHDGVDLKIFDMADAARGDRSSLPCILETALPHNRCMIAALLSCEIRQVPEDCIADLNGERFAVKEIDGLFAVCSRERRMPKASDLAWAAIGKEVRLDDPAIIAYGS